MIIVNQLVVFPLDEPRIALLVHRALRLDLLGAFGAEIKLSRIACVIILNVKNRFVREAQRDFGGNRLAFVIFRRHRERAFVARLILRAVGFHLDVQEIFHWRHDYLFRVSENLPVVHQCCAEENIRRIFFVHGQVHKLHRAV